ncbi:hypothetical protein ACFL29_01845 [Patescibacteria group bacterium]
MDSRPKGMTLIETTIGISIFIIATLIILSLFIFHTQLYKVQEAESTIKIHSALFTKHFQETGKTAKTIYATQMIGGISRTSSSSTIIFQLPALDISNNVILSVYDYIAFYRDGSNLYMETEADVAGQRRDIKRKISDKVSELFFRYNTSIPSSATSANAYLYLVSDTSNNTINTTIRLRNKE